jgi:hypothetical protein
MNDDAIYKAYCAKHGIEYDEFSDFIKASAVKHWHYKKFKYSIRIYAFYLVFRMPFIVAWVKIKRLFR